MSLVDYISRNPCQPAKSISKSDEFLVATLSRIQADAKLIHQEKNISAVKLNKFYSHNKTGTQMPTILY